MKNKILFFVSIIPLICSIYINYLVNESFKEQSILLFEFNNYQLNFPTNDILTFNHTFPSISATGLPLGVMKARYLFNDSRNKEAIQLVHSTKKANPYLGISAFTLANYYMNNNIDSAYYYSKIASSSLPRNVFHTKNYFKTLLLLEKEKELDSAFSSIKNFNLMAQWQQYIFTKLELNNSNREGLKGLVKEAELYVDDQNQLSTLKALVNVGFEGLSGIQAIVLKAEQLFDQQDFVLSAINFLRAAELNPSRYNYYENAALAYYLGGELEEARKLFTFILKNFQKKRNGKSEFYLGVLEIEKKNKNQGCIFLKEALKKQFSGTRKVIENYCY
jgi:tetratricopeptide (TPR) repeat protein|tara:strand:- start:215 stop:1213 length:999 start_codon:yes stop_codon:yes gene_type:complete